MSNRRPVIEDLDDLDSKNVGSHAASVNGDVAEPDDPEYYRTGQDRFRERQYNNSNNSRRQNDNRGRPGRSGFIDPFGMMNDFESRFGFGSIFGGFDDNIFDSHFSQMDEMMRNTNNNPNTHVYMSSTSTTTLPGGVTEVKRTVRTNGQQSEEHLKAIGDKKVVHKKQIDLNTGRQEERSDYYNINENEMDKFNRDADEILHNRTLAFHESPSSQNNNSRRRHFGALK